MHTEVNAGESNSGNQDSSGCPDANPRRQRLNSGGQKSGQHSIETKRKQRMPAGKAVSVWQGPEERRRTLAMESVFQRKIKHQCSGQRDAEPQRRPTPTQK